MFAKRAPENWRQTSPQRIPCNSKLAHKGRKDTNPLLRIFLGRGFSYIAYLSNLRYHRITKQSGGCYNGKIHNGRTHRTYELVGDYYLVAGDEGPELEPIGIDWMIPDMNGLEVVRRVRRLIGEATPIIILTAYDWTDIEVEARDAGVTAFCAKPLFLSELRRVLAEPFRMEEQAEPTENAAEFAGKRLLVVEDNALNREIAVTMLEEAGFAVDTAENGKLAVDKVRESAPGYYDLVLMDIQMPVMNGYEATRAIRALPDAEKAALPIVAITANAFDEDRQNAAKAGMNGHLSKPFDMQQLLAMIEEVL